MIGAVVALALFCALLLVCILDETIPGPIKLDRAAAIVVGLPVAAGALGWAIETFARLAWAWLVSGALA